jgi:hypothetical protein
MPLAMHRVRMVVPIPSFIAVNSWGPDISTLTSMARAVAGRQRHTMKARTERVFLIPAPFFMGIRTAESLIPHVSVMAKALRKGPRPRYE